MLLILLRSLIIPQHIKQINILLRHHSLVIQNVQVLLSLYPCDVVIVVQIILNLSPLESVAVDEVSRDSVIEAENHDEGENEHEYD